MSKSAANGKSKGHRSGASIKYHIPFYTSTFFEPEKELEEGETKVSHKMVKLPIKIASDGDESRSNVTNFEIKGISHFDNNIENVLETFMQLNERVIKPNNMGNKNEEFKRILKYFHLLCSTGPATQTLQEAMKVARTQVVEQYLLLNHTMADGISESLKEDKTLF